MAAAQVVTNAGAELQEGYLAPSCTATGAIRSSLFHPDGYSLWQVDAELAEGAELRWGADHGDEAVFVVAGEVEVDGKRCGPDGSVIIEAGVPATIRASRPSTIVHCGPADIEPPSDGLFGAPRETGRGMHVLSLDEARPLGPDGRFGVRYFADSTCETCRIAFFKVTVGEASNANSHIHSEDEIIRVLTGELHVGPTVVAAGTSVAIPGNYRYGFRTPGPFSFLNYRRDASTYVAAPGTDPVVETVDAWRASRAAQAESAAAGVD